VVFPGITNQPPGAVTIPEAVDENGARDRFGGSGSKMVSLVRTTNTEL